MDLALNNNRFRRAGAELALVSVLTLGAFLLRLGIDPFVGDKHQFLPAFGAIAIGTWLMGWRAGVGTSVLSLLTCELFGPVSTVDAAIWHVALAYMGYVGVAAAIVSVAEWMRHAKREAALESTELRLVQRRTSDFMALLGHELRSPLAAMALGERLLKSGSLDATALRGTAEMMERQTERMSRVVGDLLDVARLRTGKLSLHPARLDVSLLVEEAAAEVRVATDRRRQEMVLRLSAAAGFMDADPVRLHQVLVNLLQNAAKFSPEGSPIELSVTGDEGWVTISVKDSGIGIAPSQLERIFEPFVQLPAGRGEERGLGLGLPLIRELVRMHGGNLRAFSAGAGRGSEFVVKLPRGVPQGALAPSQTVRADVPGASDSPSAAQDRPAGRRIMVVDDNPDAAATFALLLQLKGHEAFTAADGKAALDVAAREQPDLVFLDIGLPDMSGLEVAVKLRALFTKQPALVALTGWGGEEDQRRSRDAGFDAHLTKPIDPEAIDAALALVHEAAREAPPARLGLQRPTVDTIVAGAAP